MAEYIEREALLNFADRVEAENLPKGVKMKLDMDGLRYLVQQIPAAAVQPIVEGASHDGEQDVVEVVHGRWTEAEDGDGAVCSVCGEDFCNVYLEVERFLYCPNCGAKMDGERKE